MTIAERLVSMPWWEWRRGIAVWDMFVLEARDGDILMSSGEWHHPDNPVPLPDLNDPATQGVLLASCRELNPTAHPRPDRDGHGRVVRWCLVTLRHGFDMPNIVGFADTYGEAIALGLIALQEGR